MPNNKKVPIVVRRRKNRVSEDASVMREQSGFILPSDTLGSYTGTPIEDEMPEQDPDDL